MYLCNFQLAGRLYGKCKYSQHKNKSVFRLHYNAEPTGHAAEKSICGQQA